MLIAETKIRVRYGETDQMGYAYYGVYAQYYEVGRVEAIRQLGFSYKDIEEKGILLPVSEFSVNYKKPAFYDDELTIKTIIKEKVVGVRIPFEYEVYNQKNELLNTGKVTLICVDKKSNKPCKLPIWFETALASFF
jgi:acyl-CoA thioester hydrolase